jgi:NADP-dependent 3-hydroxy acid dehydrogenase YdfG
MPAALVWGASGGIGRALVQHLKSNGWRVFAAARADERIPPEADVAYSFDAGDPHSIEQVCRLTAQEVDAVDLAIYAAGGTLPVSLEKTGVDQWQAIMAANLTGAFLTTQAVLPLLSPSGHIMIIGAHHENIVLPRMGAYVVAKTALAPLVTIFQKENRKLKFTLVKPPAIDTGFWANVPFKLPATAWQPSQVAQAILTHYESGASGELDLH